MGGTIKANVRGGGGVNIKSTTWPGMAKPFGEWVVSLNKYLDKYFGSDFLKDHLHNRAQAQKFRYPLDPLA